MMTVERKESEKRTVLFKDLPIGEVYSDTEGRICIKLNNVDHDNSFTCGFNDEDIWEMTTENRYTEVTPLKATLTIWE